MKNRLIYLVKHNRAIQMLYRAVMSLFFRILGFFIPTDPKLILFSSFSGKQFNDSPKAIFDYLSASPEYAGFTMVWALNQPEKYPGLNTVKMDSLRYFSLALKAKYWVTNVNMERGLHFKKKNTVYLNTWHGVALKKIGNDCPGRKDYDFSAIDYLAVSGDHDERVFQSAFRADPGRYLRCGMPRNDALWQADSEAQAQMKLRLGIPPERKVILYAPTWRESEDGGRSFCLAPPVDFSRWQERLGEITVLFRAHSITTRVLGVETSDFVRDVSDYPDVNDLMIASDLLITDYSAIAFDYSILSKPILCFAYDYDAYRGERGLYFDMEGTYPCKICRTEEELLDELAGLDEAHARAETRRFRGKFIQYGPGATEACVRALLSDEKTSKKGDRA